MTVKQDTPKHASLAAALVAAQAEMPSLTPDAVNPHYRSKYATLAHVAEAVISTFNAAGVAVVQFPHRDDTGVGVRTVLIHVSGETMEHTYTLPLQRADPQAGGGAITYARRYALCAIAGVAADEDDDAQEASQPAQTAQAAPRATNAPKAAATPARAAASGYGYVKGYKYPDKYDRLWVTWIDTNSGEEREIKCSPKSRDLDALVRLSAAFHKSGAPCRPVTSPDGEWLNGLEPQPPDGADVGDPPDGPPPGMFPDDDEPLTEENVPF